MKILFYLSLLLLVSCKKENVTVDFCVDCTSSLIMNGNLWDSKLFAANFTQNRHDNDTSFGITIIEKESLHDEYHDALNFGKIPYRKGKYIIDSLELSKVDGIRANFYVYEYEYDTHEEEYSVVPDGNSYVEVIDINKSTNTFQITFNLKLSISGGLNGTLHQSTYPKILVIESGSAQGYIVNE